MLQTTATTKNMSKSFESNEILQLETSFGNFSNLPQSHKANLALTSDIDHKRCSSTTPRTSGSKSKNKNNSIKIFLNEDFRPTRWSMLLEK